MGSCGSAKENVRKGHFLSSHFKGGPFYGETLLEWCPHITPVSHCHTKTDTTIPAPPSPSNFNRVITNWTYTDNFGIFH